MKRFVLPCALVLGVIAASIPVASPVNALSVFDEEHYQMLMGEYGPSINEGPIGNGRFQPGFDPTCPYPIGLGKCRGRSTGGVSGGGVSVSNPGSGSLMDMPEDAENREGDGKKPKMDSDEVSRKIQKKAIKKLLKRVLKTRIPKNAIELFWRVLEPSQTATDDVIHPDKKAPDIFDEDGNQIGETRVPENWRPDGIDYPSDLRNSVNEPTEEADATHETDTQETQDEKEAPEPSEGETPESNENDGGQGPVTNTLG
ncbi:hypothetical protein [Actibacterium lipolyticum]|uniref:Uncharacterized protein n=1 Tax=Actibacterium lipolyticum TaxID=1524263 RepID=A0A238L8X8_9RHOB|nr:hypothetical protein [Actibacterium lipolyticum]SMX51280.1 hypothetical protein COL8621_03811 [Actibacterium lipolyticum]